MCLGDSTYYGVSTSVTTGTVAQSWPKQWAAFLRLRGETVAQDAIFGQGGVTDIATYDARVVFSGTAPTQTGTAKTCGGWSLRWAATGAMAFTPSRNVDTFVVYYLKSTTAGTANVNYDGGSNTLLTATNASFSIATQTVSTGSVGSHTLNLAWASGQFDLIAVDAYDSTIKQIKIWGAGFNGSTTTDWARTGNGPWDPTVIIKNTFQPHLVIANLGINDWRGAISDATTASNWTTIIANLLVSSDVILETPNPETGVGTYSWAAQLGKINAIRQVAISNNLPIIDAYSDWVDADGTGTVMNGLGMYSDTIHPPKKGYADKMQRIDRFIGI